MKSSKHKYIMAPGKRIPVAGKYDVVVVGGGVAGCAAAAAAARNGARVALVEKTCGLGGLATLANVVVYLPLCDGNGRQVVKGLGEEFLKLSIRDGYDEIPACWKRGGNKAERVRNRLRVYFNPASFLLALEELLIREGVTLLYDTRFCDVRKKGRRIEAVLVENKDGRSALPAGTIIDASGDADVCARAGERTVSLATNGRAGWFFYTDGDAVKLCKLSAPYDPLGGPLPKGAKGYAGDEARGVTEHLLNTRKMMRAQLKRFAAKSSHPVRPFLIPLLPALRMTRRLKGKVELQAEDDHREFPDSIGLTGDWRKHGPIYEIPLRALLATRTDNLVVAGRCISAASAWDITRAIPSCAVTGQAAGTAAALVSELGAPRLRDVDLRLLQDRLREQGALVNMSLRRQ